MHPWAAKPAKHLHRGLRGYLDSDASVVVKLKALQLQEEHGREGLEAHALLRVLHPKSVQLSANAQQLLEHRQESCQLA